MTETVGTSFNLMDFGVVDEQVSISELLHSSYLRGRQDLVKEIENDFRTNLQSAAQSSSLLKSKLSEKGIGVVSMFIKVLDFRAFRCLVVLDADDFYHENKCKKAYFTAHDISDTNSHIEMDFSFMPDSEHLDESNITSDGYFLKYAAKQEV